MYVLYNLKTILGLSLGEEHFPELKEKSAWKSKKSDSTFYAKKCT